MKLGETIEAIYALSLPVQDGYKTPGYPYDEAVRILESINGGIVDTINFGAREHRAAEFNLVYLPRADHFTLGAYLEANLGKKIRVQFENAGERIFGEQYAESVYYAYLADFHSLGETSFSQAHTLYGYFVKLELAGTLSTSVPNAANASQYEFLLEIDTVRASHSAANKAALDALTGVAGGAIGLTIDTLKVYMFDPVSATWKYQWPLVANNAALGLSRGIFRLAAFADVLAGSEGITDEHKAGLIRYGSIKPPRYAAPLRNGPCVEHPEGFSFALENSADFWTFAIDNSISFYGAKCRLYIYDRLSGRKELIRTGYNVRNLFDHMDYTFEVQPRILNQNTTFPNTLIGPSNYPDAADKMKGKAVLATYGRFELGEIQATNFTMQPVKFSNGRRYLGHVSGAGAPTVDLDMDASYFSVVLGYAYGSYPTGNVKWLYLQIVRQDEQPELSKLIKVTAIALPAADRVRLTLQRPWQVAPDGTAQFQLFLSCVELILDDDACIGYKAPGYLKGTAEAGEFLPIEIWAQQEGTDELRLLPSKVFKPVGSNENKLTVDTEFLNLDSQGNLITEHQEPVSLESPLYMHRLMDTLSGAYMAFNFGFSPDGVESNEVQVRPFAKLKRYFDQAASGMRGSTPINGDGAVRAAFSADRVTLIWTPYQGATSYTVSRFLVTLVKQPVDTRGSRGVTQPIEELKLDTAFGTAGEDTVFGEQTSHYVDTTADPATKYLYEYRIQPNGLAASLASNRGKPAAVKNGAPGIYALGKNEGITIAWPIPAAQSAFTVEIDSGAGWAPVADMPVVSTTLGYYNIPSLTNNTKYKVRVKLRTVAGGASGDTWFSPSIFYRPWPVWQHKPAAHAGTTDRFLITPDSVNSNLLDPLLYPDVALGIGFSDVKLTESNLQYGFKAVNAAETNGTGFPAAAVVFSHGLKLNHQAIGDMSGARDVRVLADFVMRSYVGTNTPVPATIQLRGLRGDKTTSFVLQYEAMTGKAPTEGSSYGAYLKFFNLPEGSGGLPGDGNYNTQDSSPNVNGLYTGKDLWKLPDFLFEDGAYEWARTEYLVWSITNAEPIAENLVRINAPGYRFGIGGPPGKSWTMVRGHKSTYYLEYVKEYKGGLDQPQFIRIDGGKKDVSGAITGTAGKPIEKMRHIVDDVVQSMLGYKPIYIGNEMKSRLDWVGRWQTKEAKSPRETLEILARNLWGFFTFTPDDKLYFRSLDIDEPSVPSVFAFTDNNILKDTVGRKEFRSKEEIFQKFRIAYNVEPSVKGREGGDTLRNRTGATEEMVIGWDLASGKKVVAGYSRMGVNQNGDLFSMDVGDEDALARHCFNSAQLYTVAGEINEFGVGQGKEFVAEMFYRPTMRAGKNLELIERDLPNLAATWDVMTKAPKRTMQDFASKVVRFNVHNAWYFPLATSLKNVVYNPAITGLKDEAGTADNKLKIGDKLDVTSIHTKGKLVKAFIAEIDWSTLYDGYVTLWMFAPRPPGQYGPLIDPNWNAQGPGTRDHTDFLFPDTSYQLGNEPGTYADAGAPGARDPAQYRFPDGTYADAEGEGSGRA